MLCMGFNAMQVPINNKNTESLECQGRNLNSSTILSEKLRRSQKICSYSIVRLHVLGYFKVNLKENDK